MKTPASFILFVLSCITVQAHPGHDLTAHGHIHLASSPYHIAMILGFSVGCFLFAELLRRSWARQLQIAGVLALSTGVLLWVAQH
jgi:hypothetical protein